MNFFPLLHNGIFSMSCHVNWHASITYMLELAYWGRSAPVVHEPNEWRKVRPRCETVWKFNLFLSFSWSILTDWCSWQPTYLWLYDAFWSASYLMNKTLLFIEQERINRCCYGFMYAALLLLWPLQEYPFPV